MDEATAQNTRAVPDAGFTLVELVTVLILIGVISALGIGLFLGKGSVSSIAARDQLLSATLLAQQRALAGGGATLSISQGADEWSFTIDADSTRTAERAGASLAIEVDGVPVSIAALSPLTFDARGEIGSNVEFAFQGESDHLLCLASTGFAYTSDSVCQP
jgi:MSHA pilin protein MshC